MPWVSLSGSRIYSRFKPNFKVLCVDHVAPKEPIGDAFFSLKDHAGKSQLTELKRYIEKDYFKGEKLHAVICVAGGFDMHDIKSPEIVNSFESMAEKSLSSSLLGAHLAAEYGDTGAYLLTTGAQSIFTSPNPAMLSYSLAKTGVHSLNLMLAKDATFQSKQIRNVCILPTTIDTPANRAAMPNADTATWINPKALAWFMFGMVFHKMPVPAGSFVEVGFLNGLLQIKPLQG